MGRSDAGQTTNACCRIWYAKSSRSFLPIQVFPKPTESAIIAVVARQNLARLLYRVFLELRQIDGRAAGRLRSGVEVVLEVLEQCLQVDVVRRVLVGAELRGVE
jgi:hypothetical protein